MVTAIIKESMYIHASPEAVYNLMADYHVGHLSVLPKPYFTGMEVIEGGFGEGTKIHVDMEVFGVKRHMRMVVTEPEKGRLLVETDLDTGTVTHFTFDPEDGGTRLTFNTTMVLSDGFAGFLEKLSTPSITSYIYKKELKNVANHFEGKQTLQQA